MNLPLVCEIMAHLNWSSSIALETCQLLSLDLFEHDLLFPAFELLVSRSCEDLFNLFALRSIHFHCRQLFLNIAGFYYVLRENFFHNVICVFITHLCSSEPCSEIIDVRYTKNERPYILTTNFCAFDQDLKICQKSCLSVLDVDQLHGISIP